MPQSLDSSGPPDEELELLEDEDEELELLEELDELEPLEELDELDPMIGCRQKRSIGLKYHIASGVSSSSPLSGQIEAKLLPSEFCTTSGTPQ